MYDVIGFLKELFGFGKAGVEYETKKLELKNTDKMEAATEAQREAAAVDGTRKEIEQKDLDALRKELSE